MSEFELRRKLRVLAGEREPAQDLWPGIVARLAPAAQRRERAKWPWAAAAALVLALGAGMFGAARLSTPDAEPVRVAAAQRQQAAWPLREALAMDAMYAGALEAAAGGRREAASLRHRASPDLRAAQREIDAAQDSLERALAQDPESVYLLDLLRQTHERRLELFMRGSIRAKHGLPSVADSRMETRTTLLG